MDEPRWSQHKEHAWQAQGGEKRMAQAKSALNRLNMRISNSSKNMEMAKSRGQYDTLKRLATDIIHYSNEREAWNRYLDHFAASREQYFTFERQFGFSDAEIISRLQPGDIQAERGFSEQGRNRWVPSKREQTKAERDAIHGKFPLQRSPQSNPV